ncbi:MAG TPA: MFS transporter [Actinocatenispora sp.]
MRRLTGGTFRSLRTRNYRLFATGQVVSNTGTWMQRIAQDWLVLSLTNSPTAVGITTALQFLPMLLFGLWGGVLADRYPKRRLLIATQTCMGLLAAALAVLTLTGTVRVGHVYLIAFLLGLATVVDNPTRQSFVTEMVGETDLRNAVSLNAAIFQAARMVGPAVAGVLINAVGAGWAFGVNALSYAGVLTGLLLMRPAELYPAPRAARARGQLRDGLRYIAGRRELVWPIVLVGFVGTFGYNWPIILSAFAKNEFHHGAGTYGVFNTLMAIGSLTGALLAARRATTRLRTLLVAAVGFGVLEVVAAATPWFWVFGPLLLVIGLLGLTFNTTANATVQLSCDPAMRGRVMGVYMLVFTGGTPIGGPLIGWVTETYGARTGLAIGGGVAALAAGVVAAILAYAKAEERSDDTPGGTGRLRAALGTVTGRRA